MAMVSLWRRVFPMNKRILFIDDDPDIVHLVKDSLESEGYEFQSASLGEEGVRMYNDWNPDLVILDMHLPDIDGFQISKQIKGNPHKGPVPIIMLTGKFVRLEDKVSGLEGGADDYILKPFEMEELLARIHGILIKYEQFSKEHIVHEHITGIRKKSTK